MDNRIVPYDQGTYYPAISVDGTYRYVYTGLEGPNGCYQYPNLVGLDGLGFRLLGKQNENLPCVYYTPGYDYVQSSYNPYNSYIPGAVIGPDTRFMGTQNMQHVPRLSYIPVIYQSQSDAVTSSHPDALNFSNDVEYSPALVPMNESAMPSKVSSDNLPGGSTQPSNETNVAGRFPEVVEGVEAYETSSTKSSQNGYMSSGGSQMTQMPIHSQGEILIEATLPANNGFSNDGIQPNQLPNRIPSDQTMGPRTNKPINGSKRPFFLKAFTTNARNSNSDGYIILNPDEYNKADFPVDYPNAKFFVIKSYSEDDVHKSIKYNVWSSTIGGNQKLNKAYKEAQRISEGARRKCPVFLFFSVNASGHFCGVAEMIGPVDFHKDMDFWLQDKWSGVFPVKWHILKYVTNSSFRHIVLVNNECRPVTSSRDTQEVPFLPGINMLAIFKSMPLKTCILNDFLYYEERQRMMYEEKRMIRLSHDTSTDDTKIKENSEKISTQSNTLVDSNNAAEDSENSTDVLTVGSMQINITEANRLISGILTIGSFPKDTDGSKR